MSQNASPFLRPVSGLVRSAGFWDVFIYNIGLISVGIGAIYTQRFGTAYYPNGDISAATLLSAAALLFVVLGFIAWTTAVPRSGGIYVFLSRAGFPGFGFAVSFVEAISWLFYVAIAAKLIVTGVLQPMAYIFLGGEASATTFLSTNLGQFCVGSGLIGLGFLLLRRGTTLFLLVQRITFVLALVGTVALLLVLVSPSAQQTFAKNFGVLLQLGGVANLSDLYSAAKAAGWVLQTPPATFEGSAALAVWPVLPLIGAAFSIAIGGEVRNSAKNQASGMLASLVVAVIAFVLIAEFAAISIGNGAQGASAFLVDAKKLTLGGNSNLDPTIALLSALATDSTFLRSLVFACFLAWIWFWVPGLLSYCQRVVLAWSLDRVAPAALGNLHPRFGTPHSALLVVALVAEVFLALIIWTEYFGTLVFILAGTIAWGLALLFGAFFPFVRNALFLRTPLGLRAKFGKLFMVISCGLGAASMALVVWMLLRDSLATGDLWRGLITVAVTFAVGLILFQLSARNHRRSGLDINKAFDEIPVE